MKKRKTPALLLAGVMMISLCSPSAVEAAVDGIDNTLLADFDFNTPAVEQVITGGEGIANVNGNCQIVEKVNGDSALYLDGTSGNYLSVTDNDGTSLLTGFEEITISFDAKQARSQKNWMFYIAPDEKQQSYPNEHYLGMLIDNGNVTVERYDNAGARPGNNLTGKVGSNWEHLDVVVSETSTKLYINGELVSNSASDYKLSEILESQNDESVFYIGKANWESGEYAGCWIDNFRVYDGILSDEEILLQYSEFAEQMFWDGISLTKDLVTEDLDLPKTNAAGETVIWTSGTPDLIGDDGALKYLPDDNTEVMMTAAIGGKTKEFTVTVAGVNTLLQKAADAIVIENADDVRGNLSLRKTGEYGVTIDWISSDPDVVTDDSEDSSLYDGGVVTRPAAGEPAAEVVLTAKLLLQGKELEKEFEIIVQPMPEEVDTQYTAGYLWTNFDASGGYEKIFFGYSEDGLKWEKLNKDEYGNAQPILVNDAEGSDLGVRDPHILRSAEGDKYWILGTDLHAEGGGAGGSGWNQTSASQNIVVWESTDLVNWSEPRLVFAGLDTAGCVWAPEAIYDESTGDYLVYWSARDTARTGDDNALRVYVCRTRDFNTFTDPVVWLTEDRQDGKETNIIDTTIVKGDDGRYYRFSTSDWYTVLDVSSTLADDDVFDVNVNPEESGDGNWKRLITRDSSWTTGGFSSGEGLTVYQLPDGTWCAMADREGYTAYLTDSLSGEEITFTKSSQASFMDGRFRHGTVMRLSESEEERLWEAFGEKKTDPSEPEAEAEEPVLEYTFESGSDSMKDTATGNDTADDGTLSGNAEIVYDDERDSNVLRLDGSNGTFAQFPTGFFDGRDTMTISMDVKSEMSSGNYFTFTYGKNSSIYNFLRIRGTEIRNAVTTSGWQNEQEVKASGASVGTWQKIDIVISGTNMKLYVDGLLVSENQNTGITTSNMGTGLISYLGKSFYEADGYFKGSFDNIKVYNRALSEEEIVEAALEEENIYLLKDAVIGTVPEDPENTTGTDFHTAVTTKLDTQNKVITSYVRKNTNLAAVPVEFSILGTAAEIKVDGGTFVNGSSLDLTEDREVTVVFGNKTEMWTLKTPEIANNPVLPGQYADPDIDYLDGKYWIFPTTDGYSGWSGTVFHAWSSEDLVNWTDEGVILDVANDDPGVNEKGVEICTSDWSVGSAWAPSIEEKDGKYYFYYCAKFPNGESAIGVAVADDPAGPYVDKGEALMTVSMCRNAGVSMGQAIDPSIFTDDDGTSYILFGNGAAAIAELNDDMMSIKDGTIRQITGLTDFRESVVVTKRDGIYHFTWSCDDAGSPNYHVNYGTADTLEGNNLAVNYRYTLLQKDESGDMLGTAHQSILYLPETDECYIAYHRFYTPIGIYTSGFGYHRETCIDKVEFDEKGLMKPVTPTMEGVSAKAAEEPEVEATLASITVTPPEKLEYTVGEELSLEGLKVTAVYSDMTEKDVTDAVQISGYDKNTAGTQTITVTYEENGIKAKASFDVTVTKAPVSDKPESDDKEPQKQGNKTTGEVQSGDTANIAVTAVIAMIALAIVAAESFFRRKKRFK